MGIASSFMGKGLASTQMSNLAMGAFYSRFVKKPVDNEEEFHYAILDIFTAINASLPGKHYDVPTQKAIQEFFKEWREIKEENERKKALVEFLEKKVKLSYLDNTALIAGVVTPPAAMVAKRAGESVPQLSILKSVPDVVFVPSLTVLALFSVKLSRKMIFREDNNDQTPATNNDQPQEQSEDYMIGSRSPVEEPFTRYVIKSRLPVVEPFTRTLD